MSRTEAVTDIAIATIASRNYLPHVRTLFESVRKTQDCVDLHLLLVDELDDQINVGAEFYRITQAKDIGIPSFSQMAFMYDITEFNTALKPFFIRYLLDKGYKKLVYLDPDVVVFSSLNFILELLDECSIILTPHITVPLPDDERGPSETTFLVAGTYNLGFIAVSNTNTTIRMLEWWSTKCSKDCFADIEAGLFVDQKWINLVPGLYASVFILRHVGCNVGYWNLHERVLDDSKVNGDTDLVFFHFSGFQIGDVDTISKYQNRFRLSERPDLRNLFEYYKKALIYNGYNGQEKIYHYKYGRYDNELRIGPMARRLYPHVAGKFPNPFSTGEGSYHNFLGRLGLLEDEGHKYEPSGDNIERNAKIINHFLLLLAKVLGPGRYDALMRYMRYIAVIRRQAFLVGEKGRVGK